MNMWREIIRENLPLLRKMLKITQRQLASAVNVALSTIINIEKGRSKTYTAVLIALVAYFSLRPKTAGYLAVLGLYKNEFVQNVGFDEKTMKILMSDEGMKGDKK